MSTRNPLNPDEMFQKADSDFPDDISSYPVESYARTILLLHEAKGLSFRAITQFLLEGGVKTNRTTVYNIYKANSEGPDDEPLVDEESGQVIEP